MKKVFGIVLALALALSMSVMATPVSAAISNVTVTQTNPIAGQLSTYNISFSTQEPIAGGEFIDITFPVGTNLTGVLAVTVGGMDWTNTVVQCAAGWVVIPAPGPGIAPNTIQITSCANFKPGNVWVEITDVINGPPGHQTLTVGTTRETAVCSDAADANVVATYELTVALDPAGGGTATDMSDESPYEVGAVVSIKAEANAGYRFVNWTTEPEVIFDNANAAETTFTMPDEAVTITANFVAVCQLTISSTTGGSVTTPGEGTFNYDVGMSVSLMAKPDDGYKFVNWTGDGITHPDSATTTVTMNGDYSIKAHFKETTNTDSTEGPSGSTSCFIATAAYGTPVADEIGILREFRDEYLLTSPLGQAFVDYYYRVSPPIAEFITKHPSLKPIVRAGLLPAVATATVAVNTTLAEKAAMVGLLVSVALAAWATRRRGRGREYT